MPYINQGGAAAVSTSVAATVPASLVAGNLLLYFASSNSTATPATPSGWASLGSIQTGGGMSMHAFSKTSTGSESGTVTLSGFTSGTKGEASISQYGPTTPGNTLSTPANTKGSDTNTSSLAIAITGAASFTTQVGDIIVCHVGIITTAATYTASATGPAIAQTGATLTNTARYSGRDTATNTVYYGHIDAAVTVGASAAPSYSATAVGTGANAAGSGAFVLIRETAATAPALPIIVLAPRR